MIGAQFIIACRGRSSSAHLATFSQYFRIHQWATADANVMFIFADARYHLLEFTRVSHPLRFDREPIVLLVPATLEMPPLNVIVVMWTWRPLKVFQNSYEFNALQYY